MQQVIASDFVKLSKNEANHAADFAVYTLTVYTLTFESTWSQKTHPHPNGAAQFPVSAHYSRLVGGIHNASVSFWKTGEEASPGIEAMVKFGGTSLTGEVDVAIQAGTALTSIIDKGLGSSTGIVVTVAFTVASDFPLLTLVAMVAPSPDWFVGVSGYSLRDNGGNWIDKAEIVLYPYDAGTEQGDDYNLSNPAEDPVKPIASIRGVSPFSDEPLGVFRLKLVRQGTTTMPPQQDSECLLTIFCALTNTRFGF